VSNPYTEPEPASRPAFEWGLASLLTGLTLLAMTPGALLVNAYVWTQAYDTLNDADRGIARVAAFAGLVFFPALAAISGLFGLVGFIAASTRRQPAALPLAGMLVSSADFFLWIGLFVHLLAILQVFA
jgi:hypothetical protein